jgi:hypothetical protein
MKKPKVKPEKKQPEVVVIRFFAEEASAIKHFADRTGRSITASARFAFAAAFKQFGMTFPGSDEWMLP